MNFAKTLVALFASVVWIGCQTNSPTEPQSNGSKHSLNKSRSAAGTYNFVRSVRNRSDEGKKRTIEAEGTIIYNCERVGSGYNIALTTEGVLRTKRGEIGLFVGTTADYVEFAPEEDYVSLLKAYETSIDGETMMISFRLNILRTAIELEEVLLNPLD